MTAWPPHPGFHLPCTAHPLHTHFLHVVLPASNALLFTPKYYPFPKAHVRTSCAKILLTSHYEEPVHFGFRMVIIFMYLVPKVRCDTFCHMPSFLCNVLILIFTYFSLILQIDIISKEKRIKSYPSLYFLGPDIIWCIW